MAITQGGDSEITASIVVLTHNRPDAVRACLGKLATHTTIPAEIIVVDNGSPEPIPFISMPHEIIRLEMNEGVCARNHALRVAKGEFILQVDDDVIVGPSWDMNLLRLFDDPKIGAAGQEGFFVNWNGLMAGPHKPPNFLDDRRPQPGDYCDLVMGYCWAWRNLQVPDSLGAELGTMARFVYDERFNPHWHEETDLQLQIKAAGYRIRCGPVVATHHSLRDREGTWGRNRDPMISIEHAAAHERLLIEKWGDKRELLGLELDRRGMQ